MFSSSANSKLNSKNQIGGTASLECTVRLKNGREVNTVSK